jgi:hypothetical protein
MTRYTIISLPRSSRQAVAVYMKNTDIEKVDSNFGSNYIIFYLFDISRNDIEKLCGGELQLYMYIKTNDKVYAALTKDTSIPIHYFPRDYIKRLPQERTLYILSDKCKRIFRNMITNNKELAGSIDSRIIFDNKDNGITWNYIDFCEDDIFSEGQTDSVEIQASKITYHTHPLDTYHLKGVVMGWPSMSDYLSVFNMAGVLREDIIHFIPSREGIYCITLKYNCNYEITREYIKKWMRVLRKDSHNKDFLQYINSLETCFRTKFWNWEQEVML